MFLKTLERRTTKKTAVEDAKKNNYLTKTLLIRKRTMGTNWSKIHWVLGTDALRYFADGELSGRKLRQAARFTAVGGDVRDLLFERGVTYARTLTRKALKRRGLA